MIQANKSATGKAQIAPLFAIQYDCLGLPEPNRWTTSHMMRTFIILILSTTCLPGADTSMSFYTRSVALAESEVRVFSTSKTNTGTTKISTDDVFTRGGRTNLVRRTQTEAGVLGYADHRFYHDGALVGVLTITSGFADTWSAAGSPYAFHCFYGPSNELFYVEILDRNGQVADAFYNKKGVLFPGKFTTEWPENIPMPHRHVERIAEKRDDK